MGVSEASRSCSAPTGRPPAGSGRTARPDAARATTPRASVAAISANNDSAIGDIIAIQENYLTQTLWQRPRKPEWSDMEYQCRNWYYYTWLSGDFNVDLATGDDSAAAGEDYLAAVEAAGGAVTVKG